MGCSPLPSLKLKKKGPHNSMLGKQTLSFLGALFHLCSCKLPVPFRESYLFDPRNSCSDHARRRFVRRLRTFCSEPGSEQSAAWPEGRYIASRETTFEDDFSFSQGISDMLVFLGGYVYFSNPNDGRSMKHTKWFRNPANYTESMVLLRGGFLRPWDIH